MKRTILLLIAFTSTLCAFSQVIVNVQLPATGLTIKSQLWNLSLINSGTSSLNIQVEMDMSDAKTNQRVLTGVTRTIALPRGITQLNLNSINPITYSVVNPAYGLDGNPFGFLPVGVFNVCYTVVTLENDAVDRLSEQCETIEVEPLSPPVLMLPSDGEEVTYTRPFFSWLPPSPYNLFQNLTYEWTLVEVLPNQSASDAVQMNLPLATLFQTPFTSVQLPSAVADLDSSKLYAWTVKAMNNFSPVANSEIWTFRVKLPGFDSTVTDGNFYYARVQPDENATYVLCKGILYYEYQHERGPEEVQFRLYDVTKTVRSNVQLTEEVEVMNFGTNRKSLDLREVPGMVNNHVYLLELTGANNQKSYLKFLLNYSE